jgi:hypothetical protein
MRLPEDEPVYMIRNLREAIERDVKQRTPAELAPAARATLVQQIAVQAPAGTYIAGGQISIEGLAHLVDEVIAEEDTEEG